MPCWYQWNSDWSKLCIPYCTEPCAIRSGMASDLVRSRMFSCTAAVLISTSDAGTRPLPSLRGTRRSDTIACSAVESRCRTSSCWCGGKNEITRLIVCVASVVWSVENTRCPVSAALSAVSSVSMSRISPIRITSGAWRSTWRSAALNESVSFPTSRCEMLDRLSRCRNSIGSSIVMMFTRRLVLMWLIIAAGRPTFSSRSDALRWTISVIADLKLKVGWPVWGGSGMGVYSEKGLSELDGLGVLHQHLPDDARDLGFDFVHDLHRFDDAHHLPRRHTTARLDVGLGARLGAGVERPHHGGLDLEQLGRSSHLPAAARRRPRATPRRWFSTGGEPRAPPARARGRASARMRRQSRAP